MDNSISSQVSETAYNFTIRAHGWAIADRSTAKLGLFEQILNIPVTSVFSQQRTERKSESESIEVEPETVNEPKGKTEETQASAGENRNDYTAPSDASLAANASYSAIQFSVPAKVQEYDSSDELGADQDLTILDQNAISETPEAALETKLLRPQKVVATGETNEQESVPQSSTVLNRTDERVEAPAQAAVKPDESNQTQPFERLDRSDREQVSAFDTANETSLSDKIEPGSGVTNATDLDQSQLTDVEHRTAKDKVEAPRELQSQSTEKTTSEEPRRREKWFEHPSKEPNSEAALSRNQQTLTGENEPTAFADQRTGLESAQSALGDPQPSMSAETTGLAAVENAAAAIAALAGSSGGSSLASTASRAIGSTPTAGGAQIAGTATTANGASGLGSSQNNSSSRASSNTSEETSQSQETWQLSQQERVRLVQRVARSFSRLSAEGGQISLRLHPPQLGSLNVSVRIEGRSMSAKLQTETAAARDAIIENLPILRQRLAEQGIEIQQFQVEMAGTQTDSSNSGFNQSSSQPESGHGQQAHQHRVDYRRFSPAVDRPLQLGSTSADRSSLASSSLDLKV